MNLRAGILLVGGGLAAGAAALFAALRAQSTTDNIKNVLDGGDVSPLVNLRLTHYYPFTASDAEKKMEGAPVDRKGKPLHTVEDFFAGKSDHVSLAGDYEVWPYGQKLLVPWGDRTLVGRVVDTGGHFHGANKVYRAVGFEPIDVCVYAKTNAPPQSKVTATIVVGDNLDKPGAGIMVAKIKDQSVSVGGLDYFGVDEDEGEGEA